MTTRLAAIDLGSNSFRLEIGRVEERDFISEEYCKEGVRLAAGLNAQGYLTESAQLRALETLSRFHEKSKTSPNIVSERSGRKQYGLPATTESSLKRLSRCWASLLRFCPDRRKLV